MSEEEKSLSDKKILNKLLGLWSFRNSEVVLCYVSNKIEVSTRDFIEEALRRNKTVAVPKCIDGTRDMDFYIISSFDDLSVGSFGIDEPDEKKCKKLESFEDSVCIVPALTFDNEGYRLGFGKGYYDRFLSGYSGTKIGICYESCITQKLPRGKYDCKVDTLVTDRRIIIT